MRLLDAFLADCPRAWASSIEKQERYARFWAAVPERERVPMLIEVLGRYRACRAGNDGDACRDESFALNELTAYVYRLGISPTVEQACAILRTAYHTCGHGSDVRPPFDLAIAHFLERPYTIELFDALRLYRESMSHSRGVVAQDVKGKIVLILWQDLRPSREWDRCVTSVIRDTVRVMPDEQRARWLALFHGFAHTIPVEPPGKRNPPRIPAGEFAGQMKAWLGMMVTRPAPRLTVAGSHVLKNLVWCSIDCPDPALDSLWADLLLVLPRGTGPRDKVAGAVSFLLTFRETSGARADMERIAARFSYPGGKIEQYWRTMSRRD